MPIHRLSSKLIVAALALAAAAPVAQAQRPTTTPAYTTADLAKLHWLEGRWRGSAQGEQPFYELYKFVNDSTIEITYFTDPSFSKATGNGRVYLNSGKVFHTAGAGRWGASHVAADGAYFLPQANAKNTFNWAYESPDAWTATLRSSATGREQVVIYRMERVK